MSPQQLEDGVWQIKVGNPVSPDYIVYAWCRNSMVNETFASTKSSPLPFDKGFSAQPVTGAPPITTKAQFLTWVCTQVGGGTLYVVDEVSTITTSTHSCG